MKALFLNRCYNLRSWIHAALNGRLDQRSNVTQAKSHEVCNFPANKTWCSCLFHYFTSLSWPYFTKPNNHEPPMLNYDPFTGVGKFFELKRVVRQFRSITCPWNSKALTNDAIRIEMKKCFFFSCCKSCPIQTNHNLTHNIKKFSVI